MPNGDFLALATKFRRTIASVTIALSILVLTKFATAKDQYEIVIASRPIYAGSTIKVSDLATIKSPFTWTTALSSIQSAVNRVAITPIGSGEPISKFVLNTSTSFDRKNPESVAVSLPMSVSGSSLHAGDRVDVFGTNQISSAELVARSALVISVAPADRNQVLSSTASGIVNLAINKSEAKNIANVMDKGTFTFIKLRNQ